MADWLDKETRSRIMSSIRSSHTKPELVLKKSIRGLGFSYQPKLPGNPDFANKKRKIAIFVHGCFWHKCPKHYREPTSNKKYWLPKIERNVRRDKQNLLILKSKGYMIFTVWEHEIKKSPKKVLSKLGKLKWK